MQYAQLFKALKEFTPEQLAQEITIRDSNGEYFPATIEYADEDNDVLDRHHPFLDATDQEQLELREDGRSPAAKIEAAVEDDDSLSLRKDYSGRGMFGKTCYGIVCDNPGDVIAQVGLPGARQDSMGKSAIVYWPSVAGE